MRAAPQQSSMGIGSFGGRESLGGSMRGFETLAGAQRQRLGGQSQEASMEQSPIGGAMEAGAMGQEALGQAGLGQAGLGQAGLGQEGLGQEGLGQAGLGAGAGLGESTVSPMTEGSLGGRAGESYQGMQGVQDMQGIQGMQGMASALTGGQQGQGGILSDGGSISALQGQGMMGASLQGGLQGMMGGGGGGGLTGLQGLGGEGDFGQQQMAFKKVSYLIVCFMHLPNITLQLTSKVVSCF